MCGLFTGEFFGIWLLIGSLMYPKKPQMLPTSIEQCPINPLNSTAATLTSFWLENQSGPTMTSLSTDDPDRTGILKFYHVAYLLVPVFGCLISLTIGLICSLLSGGCKTARKVPPQYLNKLAWSIWPSNLLPEKCDIDRIEYGSTVVNGNNNKGYIAGQIISKNDETNNNNQMDHIKSSDIQLKECNDAKKLNSATFTKKSNGVDLRPNDHNPRFDNVKRSRIIKQNAFDVDDDPEFENEKTKILAYRAYSPDTDTNQSVTPSILLPAAFSSTTTLSNPSSSSASTLSDSRTTPISSLSNSSSPTPETNRKS